MSCLPDFITIGAMKCATSTLHDQLAQQPGLFMSAPKEPNFFSNDDKYARGLSWYAGLFANVPADALCGESSTHYTKLPTYPHTVDRMRRHLGAVKLIYIMRHPIDRLISQYIHEWTQRTVPGPIDVAVRRCPRLIDYSLYSMQLRPYAEAYGWQNILPVFFERLVAEPQAELERVCRFIGYEGAPRWQLDIEKSNVSSQRLRKSLLRDVLVGNLPATWVRRKFIPQRWRDRVKRLWQMSQRPEPSAALRRRLTDVFDDDLLDLGQWLGVELTCENFKATTVAGKPFEFAPCLEECER